MPNFSVIIPVYNSEKYLKRCLDSVIVQTFKDFELICIDDGSSDGSLEILSGYNDGRIKVITQKNMGQGAARNRGLDVACGKYIYFLDSDDYIEPNLLQCASDVLESADVDLYCFNTEVCGNGEGLLYKRAKRYAQLTRAGLLEFSDEIRDLLNVYVWNKVFRSDLIQKYSIRFPQNLCYEDIAFCKMYFLVCNRVYFDMRRLHHYVIRENSLMDLNFGSELVAVDHFRNWHEILNMTAKDKELFMQSKDILEKWFWDYYFMTKGMLKTSCEELEKLKVQYFEDFQGLI